MTEQTNDVVNIEAVDETGPVLVLGGTGKTGRRVVERLTGRGVPVRVGSRSGEPRFDWNDRSTWAPVLEGMAAVYVAYYPDLALPGSDEVIRELCSVAPAAGADRIVLLSGRGEEEAEAAEQVLKDSGAGWTVVRADWFAQNFSEDWLLESVLSGEVELPAGDVPVPFVDAWDVADVAVAALTEEGHAGRTYELSGPRAMTFAEAIGEIAAASGRPVTFREVSIERFTEDLQRADVPGEVVGLLTYLFSTVLDGRNARPADGVRQALGREPRDFADYARETAATGVWS
ncbi:NAD(P)H-binding protein [Actinomadura viridis]|uniref:NAD(P)H-binding protein n=1 Tax=Actinomadura viridis TaxID=58110 RepID=UPI00367E2192